MTDTPNLGLPFIEAAQAQKHVPHNEALRVLDMLVQLSAEASNLTSPPPTPAEGRRWIVAASATGAWSGHDNAVAVWQDAAWVFLAPMTGWVAYDVATSQLLAFTGSAWENAAAHLATLQNMTLLGVGATADATNPFSAKLNNALWTARTAGEGGDGDLRYKMNKETAGGTVSLLMQTGFSGRAEVGLTGDDDLRVKVSADGSNWTDSLVVTAATGDVATPRVLTVSNTTASTNTTTGSGVFAGGVGIGGAANIGGGANVSGGDVFVTRASPTAFVVGPNGVFNPAFRIRTDATNGVTGLMLLTTAAGSGVALQTTSANADERLFLDSKGSGTLNLNAAATGNVTTPRPFVITNATASTSATTGALIVTGGIGAGGNLNVGGKAGFNGTAAIVKPVVSGSRGGNAALASLLTALADYGLITDSTSA